MMSKPHREYETLRHMNNIDGERNASDTRNRKNRIQDNPFRPYEITN